MTAIGHRRHATVLWRLGEYFLSSSSDVSCPRRPCLSRRREVRAFAQEAVNKGVVVAGSGLIKMGGLSTL
jgi:hypothetical protein